MRRFLPIVIVIVPESNIRFLLVDLDASSMVLILGGERALISLLLVQLDVKRIFLIIVLLGGLFVVASCFMVHILVVPKLPAVIGRMLRRCSRFRISIPLVLHILHQLDGLVEVEAARICVIFAACLVRLLRITTITLFFFQGSFRPIVRLLIGPGQGERTSTAWSLYDLF
jgi:hypothetical protein